LKWRDIAGSEEPAVQRPANRPEPDLSNDCGVKKLDEERRGANEEKTQLGVAKVPRIAGALFPLARHLRARCAENEKQN
jgi:hypothetical protein